MQLRRDRLGEEIKPSDFDWMALSVPNYEIAIAGRVKSAAPRQLGVDFEWSSVSGAQSTVSAKSTLSAASFGLGADDTISPPVSAPAADVTRKWNFDNTGRDDLVFRAANGRDVIVLASNGTRYTLATPMFHRLAAIADFSGDGIADLLFGQAPGGYQVYFVTNTNGEPSITNTLSLQFGGSETFIGFGDLRGSGKADFVFRNVSDGTGSVLVQLNILGSSSVTILQTLSFNWSLAGIGDINGDGRDDMIWRHVDNTVATWLMGANGVSFTSVGLPSVGHEWKLEAVTRLNAGDQLNDLVWRNVVSGRTIGWLMSATGGASISSVVELGSFGFDLEYVTTTYDASEPGNGGLSPQIIWRRTDGVTLASSIGANGKVAGEALLEFANSTETHFRTKVSEIFDFGARSMWGPTDVLEPMRTRNFGGMGASGGNTGRIPLVQQMGTLTVLYATGGGLAQFTPQSAGGGNFAFSKNMVLVGMGDFNSDGVGIDILYRDSVGGNRAFIAGWNPTINAYEGGVAAPSAGMLIDSRIIGFGQIDTTNTGDEIVWQTPKGVVAISRVNAGAGGVIAGTATTFTRVQSRDWIGQGVIDLDGNGIGDIVWRNANTGAISYWSMNASDLLTIHQVNINTTPVTLEWDLVGMGDLDGDGDGDLIWRRNTDGFLATWLFQGGQLGSVAGINARGWDWRFDGTSDVNGDGKTDLIWRNTSGQYAADLMNGAVVTSTILSGAITFDRATMGWDQAFLSSL